MMRLHAFALGAGKAWWPAASLRHPLGPAAAAAEEAGAPATRIGDLLSRQAEAGWRSRAAGIAADYRLLLARPTAPDAAWLAVGDPAFRQGSVELTRLGGAGGAPGTGYRITPAEGSAAAFFGCTILIEGSRMIVASFDRDYATGHLDLFDPQDPTVEPGCRFIARIDYPAPTRVGAYYYKDGHVALGGRHLVVSSMKNAGEVFFYDVEEMRGAERTDDLPVAITPLAARQHPEPLDDIALGWTGGVDAALAGVGELYLFKVGQFQHVDAVCLETDLRGVTGPGGWDGLWVEGLEAATVNPYHGSVGFFRSGRYQHRDRLFWRLDGPLEIGASEWAGITKDRLDAAFCHPHDGAFFLQGMHYQRYSFEAGMADATGLIGDLLPGAWEDGIDAAACPVGDDRIFLFKGGRFQIYDVSEARVVHEGALAPFAP